MSKSGRFACIRYYVNEEEIPSAGSIVTSWRRIRWFDGRTFLWIGCRRDTGRGQGSSNLCFDQTQPVKE
jgi:hypothetical protein